MENLLKKAELAEKLKVGVRTIENWMTRDEIPFYKMRKVVRFELEEVKNALRKRSQD